jgi:hypothetical protein
MASRFEISMTKANEKVFDHFKEAEEITFTPKGGEAFSTEAILGPIDGEIRDDETGESLIKTRRITIPVPETEVEYADGIATIAGEDWVVTEPGSVESGYVELQCGWNKATSKHGERHRKKAT